MKKMNKKTILVNLYGGPGCGKTTIAWELSAMLKKLGISVEYIPEYAKELYYEGAYAKLDGSYQNECEMLQEKWRRISRYQGQIEVIVCDSPFLQSVCYTDGSKMNEEEFEFIETTAKEYNIHFDNWNYLLERMVEYQQEGRLQPLKESYKIDAKIRAYLSTCGQEYKILQPASVENSVENAVYEIAAEVRKRRNEE